MNARPRTSLKEAVEHISNRVQKFVNGTFIIISIAIDIIRLLIRAQKNTR